MTLKLTNKKIDIKMDKEKVLEDIPLYEYEGLGDRVLFSDLFKAEEKRIAKKHGINVYNIFELALLYADVKQRKNAIRQKFRFNKKYLAIDQRS